MSDLSTKAMLAAWSASMWTPRKYDKKASKKAAEDNGVVEEAVRLNKNLFPFECDSYKAVVNAFSKARETFYEETLPWLDNGSRILPAPNFLNCSNKIRDCERAIDDALPVFYERYPFLQRQSKTALNGLWREEDFPPLDKLKDKFSHKLSFYPLPDQSDFRVDLNADDVAAIKAQISTDVKSTIAASMKEPYQRLFDGVAHMASRLSGAKTCPCRGCKGKTFSTDQFGDSLVSNLVKICENLPRLNLTGDPYLDAYIEQVKISLTEFDPGVIRDSEQVKTTLADRAKQIQEDLAGWMNAA